MNQADFEKKLHAEAIMRDMVDRRMEANHFNPSTSMSSMPACSSSTAR